MNLYASSLELWRVRADAVFQSKFAHGFPVGAKLLSLRISEGIVPLVPLWAVVGNLAARSSPSVSRTTSFICFRDSNGTPLD